MSAIQAIRNFNLARAEGDVQDRIGKFNARIEENRALEALRTRSREADRLRKQVKRIQSSNIAKGAPLFVLAENAATAAIDDFNIRQQGVVEDRQSRTKAQLQSFKGRSAKLGSRAKANSILIDFAADTATKAVKLGLGGL